MHRSSVLAVLVVASVLVMGEAFVGPSMVFKHQSHVPCGKGSCDTPARLAGQPRAQAVLRMTAAAEAEAAFDFSWRKQWYPIAFESLTSKEKPFAFTLLGTKLVVWFDFVKGEWCAVSDRCPHRLAPLSEGRIDSRGRVECPYHGWAFEGSSGACSSIPHLPAADPIPPRACVESFPVAVSQGAIWVWAEAAGAGAARPSEALIHRVEALDADVDVEEMFADVPPQPDPPRPEAARDGEQHGAGR